MRRFFFISGFILIAGLALSSFLAEDGDWWLKSISDLGIDRQAGIIFNGMMIIFGASITPIIWHLSKTFQSQDNNIDHPRGDFIIRLIHKSLLLIPFCIMGIGLVPYTVSVNIHNTFAIAIVLIFSANAVISGLFEDNTGICRRYTSLILLFIVAVSMILFVIQLMSYVVFEFILIFSLALWVYFLNVICEAPDSGQQAV